MVHDASVLHESQAAISANVGSAQRSVHFVLRCALQWCALEQLIWVVAYPVRGHHRASQCTNRVLKVFNADYELRRDVEINIWTIHFVREW